MGAGKILSRIAMGTHRTQREAALLTDTTSVVARYALLSVLLVVFAVIFVPVVSQLAHESSAVAASVAIPKESWRVYFGGGEAPCPYDASAERGCPVNQAYRKLWQSSLSRADAQHRERVLRQQGREFWIGAELPAEALKRAARSRANVLILGWIRATFRLWVDDQYVMSGSINDIEPISVVLPMSRLSEPRPLRIAIQIVHDGGHPFPDLLNSGLLPEGLVTYGTLRAFELQRIFIMKVRPICMTLGYLVVAALFFLLWSTAKSKQEYFYMAVYAFVSGMYFVPSLDVLGAKLDLRTTYALNIVDNLMQGGFAMLLGFSFARLRSKIFRVTAPLVLVGPWLVVAAFRDPATLFFFRETLNRWILPGCSIVGGASCLVQATYLYIERGNRAHLSVRMQRLVAFGLGLFAIAFFGWLNADVVVSAAKHAYWFKIANFGLIWILGLIVFHEYRERERLVERAPVSEYHRRPVLPDRISGVIVVADLKGSEAFYRHRAEHGDSQTMVSIWRAHFYTSILKNGGCILHTKGDEVIGFFDRDKREHPLHDALKAINEMHAVSSLLDADFRNRDLYPKGTHGLNFRASMTEGEIRPIWESLGTTSEASWEEAGTTSPFVEASRLLEIERRFGGPAETLLIIPQKLVSRLEAYDPGIADGLCLQEQVVPDKHGQLYTVAVYAPGSSGAADLDAA